MKRDRAVARMQQILGFRTDLQMECIHALQDAQEDGENGYFGFLPYFLRRKMDLPYDTGAKVPVETIGNIGRAYVPLPNMLREYDKLKSALFIANIGPIKRVQYIAPDGAGSNYDEAANYWLDMTPYQVPDNEEYTRVDDGAHTNDAPNGRIIFNNTFLDGLIGEYLYYMADAEISEDADTENAWLQHASQWMIGHAGLKLSGIKNKDAIQIFEDMRAKGHDSLLRNDTAWEMSSQRPEFGADDDRVLYDYGQHEVDSAIAFNDIDIRVGTR